MMTSDKERREIARRLRAAAKTKSHSADYLWKRLEIAVNGWRFGDGIDESYVFNNDVLSRLADLIEPHERTCRILQAYGDETEELDHCMEEIACTPEDTVACICQSCGHEFRYDRMVRPRFCPCCGARVVDDD